MRGFDIALLAAAVGLIGGGLSDGDIGLGLGGLAVLLFLWAFRRWMKKNDMEQVLSMKVSGSGSSIRRGDSGELVGYVWSIPPDQVKETVRRSWGLMWASYPRKRAQLVVWVRDTDGRFWGMDSCHVIPPYVTLEPFGKADPSNVLVGAAISHGSIRQLDDGLYYSVIPADPWGPFDKPAPLHFIWQEDTSRPA